MVLKLILSVLRNVEKLLRRTLLISLAGLFKAYALSSEEFQSLENYVLNAF